MPIKINWLGTMGAGQGYSGSAEKIILALDKLGVDIRILGITKSYPVPLTAEAEAIRKKTYEEAEIGMCYGFPHTATMLQNKKIVLFSMFETDRLPNGINAWAGITGNAGKTINNFNVLIVPSYHNKRLFIKEGVDIPIYVIPLGVDEKFTFKQRVVKNTFTFLWVGTFTKRKDPLLVVDAFKALYSDRGDVKLILKTSGGIAQKFDFGSNIEVIDRILTEDELINLYHSSDCFVFPSRGEGFGLPPLEAIATGMPTIMAYNTGMIDILKNGIGCPLEKQTLEPAEKFKDDWGEIGNWSVSDIDELKEKMSYVYNNQEKCFKQAKEQSDFVKKVYTYQNTALKIKKILEVLNGN